MTEITAVRGALRAPTHPGVVLAEAIAAIGRPKVEIAKLLGLSRQSLYDIIDGKQPVTATTAVRLGKLFGNGPTLWINMQAAHDLWKARLAVDLSKIPTLEPAA